MAGSPAVLYPNLRGDLTSSPVLLQRLQTLAARLGKTFTVTSGLRTDQQQLALWNNRATNPYPVAKPKALGGPGSNHESGRAADVLVDGQPIQTAVNGSVLKAAGISPLSGDAVHVELPADSNGGIDIGQVIGNVAQNAPVVGPFVQDINAATSGGDNPISDAANAAAKATAGALVGLVMDAIGANGARLLLAVGLAGAALALIYVGATHAAGIKPTAPAAALARAVK